MIVDGDRGSNPEEIVCKAYGHEYVLNYLFYEQDNQRISEPGLYRGQCFNRWYLAVHSIGYPQTG